MNCDALSLTGEREVLATAIYLIKQTIDTDTGVFATTLRNIYTLFLQADDLLQEFEATSQSPASAAAIATYVANELQGYRLKNVDIPMDQVENLFKHLQNYRLKSNQTFTALICDTLSFLLNGSRTDLASEVTDLGNQITVLETKLRGFQIAQTGSEVAETETTLQTYIATHARDKLTDLVWNAGKNHQNFITGNEWGITWSVPSHYICHLNTTNRVEGFRTDSTWTMATMADLKGRYVWKRGHIDPSVFNFPGISPVPSGDNRPIDLGHVFYADVELRGIQSFLLGKKGTGYAGAFRVKSILNYVPEGAASFGGDPTAVHDNQKHLLFQVDPDGCHINVPVFVNGQPIAQNTVQKTHHSVNVDQHQTVHIKRTHRHAHTHIFGGDHYETYVAPQRNVTNRITLHNINTFDEHTNLQTINRIYRSVQTLPNYLHTEVTQFVTRQNWASIRGKPDFDSLYASHQDVTDATEDKQDSEQVAGAITTALQAYTDTTTLAADYVSKAFLTNELKGYLKASHTHDFDNFYTKDAADAEFASQTNFNNHVGAVANSLAIRPTNVQIQASYYERNTPGSNPDATTFSSTEIDNKLVQKVSYGALGVYLDGNGSNLPGYVKKTEITAYALAAGNVDTTTENYLRRTQTYSDGLQVSWRQSGEDKQMILVNLSAFNALVARVTALESQMQSASNNIITIQSSVTNVTQQAIGTAQQVAAIIANLGGN